jgi:phosphoadenosine phosphosulfate reductase
MVKVFGVRAAESARRKANWKIWQPSRSGKEFILNPILYWSDENVWQYTHDNYIRYCKLYDEGYSRLGCIGCPMSGDGRKRDFLRWPRYATAWKRAIFKSWNLLHNFPTEKGKDRYWARFQTPEEMWSWWMEEMPKHEDENDCQMGLF